jgi:hypothetical protein
MYTYCREFTQVHLYGAKLFLYKCNQTLFFDIFLVKKIPNTEFNESSSSVSSVDPSKQKDRHTNTTKLTPTLTLRNLVQRLQPVATVPQRTNS